MVVVMLPSGVEVPLAGGRLWGWDGWVLGWRWARGPV